MFESLFPILNRSTMVVIACPINGCEYATEDLQEESLLAKLIELHMLSHTSQSSAKAPKLARPTIDVGANEERWNAFKRRWETFRRGSRIEGAEASAQLFECAGTELSVPFSPTHSARHVEIRYRCLERVS